ASPAAVELNSTAIVEATLTAGSDPVAGETIEFSVQPSTAGYFTPETAVSDANGIAATIFTATTAGTIMITATNVEQTTQSASTSVEVTNTQQSSGNVSLSITPNLLLANGTDSAVVTVSVRDALGQPAPDNTLVRIAAGEKFVDVDGNGYWSAGIDSLVFDANANGTWDAFGLIPSTAVTSAGAAGVTFVSGNDAQTVYVKVSVNEGGITGEAETSLQLSPDATPDFIYLASDSMSLSVTQTGGIEVGLLRAVIYDVNANPVPEGLNVSFYILDGPGGGEHLGNVDQGPYETVTNSQGIASATIHSGSRPGTIRIRATCGGVLSNATQVLVSAGPPAYIVMGVADCNVPYWGGVAYTNDVVAVVSDIYLNPVNDGEVIYFSCDEGTMKSHEAPTVGLEGVASSHWISGTQVPTADGIVWVYAECAGGTVACTTFFFNSWLPATIIVSGALPSIVADGESSFWVNVTGLDLNGNPVVGGTTFKGRAANKMLTVGGGTFENGCWGSSDDVEIKSKVLTKDLSMPGGDDDGIGGVETVTFWHEAGASTSINVAVTTGFAYRGNCSMDMAAEAGPGETGEIVVTIKDRAGNPLGDHTIEIPGGSTIETNLYGEASFLYTVPVVPGSYVVTATDLDPRGNMMLSTTITVE
ncbi:MAG: hypothetical protein KAW61_07415, partial [candidate division Zixibacteria bacterium]|nr:hypothetical protein [candidate division Zixibacteria bacterium]